MEPATQVLTVRLGFLRFLLAGMRALRERIDVANLPESSRYEGYEGVPG